MKSFIIPFVKHNIDVNFEVDGLVQKTDLILLIFKQIDTLEGSIISLKYNKFQKSLIHSIKVNVEAFKNNMTEAMLQSIPIVPDQRLSALIRLGNLD